MAFFINCTFSWHENYGCGVFQIFFYRVKIYISYYNDEGNLYKYKLRKKDYRNLTSHH